MSTLVGASGAAAASVPLARMTALSPPVVTRSPALPLVATAVALLAYLVSLHWLIASRRMPWLLLALIVAPWVIALVPAVATNRRPIAQRVAFVVALVLVAAVLLREYGDRIVAHGERLLYLENVIFLLALATTFALTMRPGAEPLITRLARVVHGGTLPPSATRYTGRVTIAWAVFFATMAFVSTVLYLTQPVEVWSAFSNLATWPLVVAMFVVEYAIRIRVVHDIPHVSMLTGVQAFRQRDRTDSGDPR